MTAAATAPRRPCNRGGSCRACAACACRALQTELKRRGIKHNTLLCGVYDFKHSDYRALMQRWLAVLPAEGGLLLCHPAQPPLSASDDAIADARLREAAYLGSVRLPKTWPRPASPSVARGCKGAARIEREGGEHHDRRGHHLPRKVVPAGMHRECDDRRAADRTEHRIDVKAQPRRPHRAASRSVKVNSPPLTGRSLLKHGWHHVTGGTARVVAATPIATTATSNARPSQICRCLSHGVNPILNRRARQARAPRH